MIVCISESGAHDGAAATELQSRGDEEDKHDSRGKGQVGEEASSADM